MPYITPDRRAAIAAGEDVETAGELNYLLTLTIERYRHVHGTSYQTCNDIVGALDNCKSEFKRRVQDPYEDGKIVQNGDVYEDVPTPQPYVKWDTRQASVQPSTSADDWPHEDWFVHGGEG